MDEAVVSSGLQQDTSADLSCQCNGPDTTPDDSKDGPLYSHLGTAVSIPSLRQSLLKQLVLPEEALRIEKLVYTSKEGVSNEGCPIAKWIIRRSSEKEQVLVIVKERAGHYCNYSVVVIAYVKWEVIPKNVADPLYDYLRGELPRNGIVTERRCGFNESKTCGCQGFDDTKGGASYSFGCSWSMFHNACKFARTKENAKKFRLKVPDHEEEMAERLNFLADAVGQVYSEIAPTAYNNQIEFSNVAKDCRLGRGPFETRAFSGVTVCMDFATHSHKDNHNMEGGSTVVCTLAKPQKDDEQYHVLTNYVPADVDEFGSKEGQEMKFQTKAIECLTNFSKITRIRAVPIDSSTIRNKKKKHAAANKPIVKEENSPASIDSGFESIKSNQSPEKGDDLHSSTMSPLHSTTSPTHTLVQQPTSANVLPPISAWFRKGSIDWVPPQTKPAGAVMNNQIKEELAAPQPKMYSLPPQQQEYHPGYQQQLTPAPIYQDTQAARYPLHTQVQSQVPYYPGQPLNDGYTGRQMTYPQYSQQQQYMSSYPARQYGAYPVPPHPQHRPPYFRQPEYAGHYCGYPPRYPYPNNPNMYYRDQYSVQYQHHPQQHQFAAQTNPQMRTNPSCMQQYPAYQETDQRSFINGNGSSRNEFRCLEDTKVLPPTSDLEQLIPPLIPPKCSAPKPKTKRKNSIEEVKNQEFLADNLDLFKDPLVGGVAIALTHGSVLIEAAKKETHATTALKQPDRYQPSRISLVFYQHKNMCYAHHGYNEYAHKMKILRQKRAEESALKSNLSAGQSGTPGLHKEVKEEPAGFITPNNEQTKFGVEYLEKLTADIY